MKKCLTCGKNKKSSEFYKTGKHLASYCKKCFNKRCYINQKKRTNLEPKYRRNLTKNERDPRTTYRKNKLRALQILGNKCSVCDYSRCTSALEFHHENPSEKEFNIAQLLGIRMSFKKISTELSKCVLLCSNCHREIHSKLPPTSPLSTLQNKEECGENL